MLSAGVLLLAAVLHRPPERVNRIYEYAPSRPVLHLAVVEAESGFNFNARNVNWDDSVDEGAYQTNSRWHPRFQDVELQLAYGAWNLERVVAAQPDLRHALGYYNTGNPHKGAAYARRVLAIYQRLLNWLGEEGSMVTGFETYTHDLTADELDWSAYLAVILRGRKGAENAISGRRLVDELFTITGEPFPGDPSRMRAMIHHLRMTSAVPCLVANSRGYYVAEDAEELDRYLKSLDERECSIRMVRSALARDRQRRFGGQLELEAG